MSVTLSATTSDGTEANHRTAGRDNPSTVTMTQRAVDEMCQVLVGYAPASPDAS